MTIDFRVSAKFKGFWYLASPYTHFPEGREAAYTLAVDTTAALLRAGVPVFSPIVHTHPPAVAGDLQQASHEFWVGVDQPMMDAAGGIVVLFAPSWEKSPRHGARDRDVQSRPQAGGLDAPRRDPAHAAADGGTLMAGYQGQLLPRGPAHTG